DWRSVPIVHPGWLHLRLHRTSDSPQESVHQGPCRKNPSRCVPCARAAGGNLFAIGNDALSVSSQHLWIETDRASLPIANKLPPAARAHGTTPYPFQANTYGLPPEVDR